MTFQEYETWIDSNYRRYNQKNADEFQTILSNLPPERSLTDRGTPVPSGCGPHSYTAMHLFLDTVRPKNLLEIGFNIGRSATFWLSNGVKSLDSMELRQSKEVSDAEVAVKKYAASLGAKFNLHYGNSAGSLLQLPVGAFDAAFIDGSHEYPDVVKDIKGCLYLKIPNLFFDDWLTPYGGIQQAIKDTDLKIVFTSGNMALCTPSGNYKYWA